jgi:hypothetical protein
MTRAGIVLRFIVIVSDLDLNADSFLDYIRAIAHTVTCKYA